jgi:hypothetical protein
MLWKVLCSTGKVYQCLCSVLRAVCRGCLGEHQSCAAPCTDISSSAPCSPPLLSFTKYNPVTPPLLQIQAAGGRVMVVGSLHPYILRMVSPLHCSY